MQTFDQFIQDWKGKVPLYPSNDKKFLGQCYQLFNFYNRDVVGAPDYLAPLAKHIYLNFEKSPLAPFYDKIEYTSGATPERGWPVIWGNVPGSEFIDDNGNTVYAGHVGMCTTPGVINFQSFDSNWGGKQAHIVEHDFSYVLGWLRPKGVKRMQQEAAEKFVSYAYRAATDTDPTQKQAAYWVERVRNDPNKAWELVSALYEGNEPMRKSPARVQELSKQIGKYQAVNGDATKWQQLVALLGLNK